MDEDFLKELAKKFKQLREVKAFRTNPGAQRRVFNIGWAFGRIGQSLEERGTQNYAGFWRVSENPLGERITKSRVSYAVGTLAEEYYKHDTARSRT